MASLMCNYVYQNERIQFILMALLERSRAENSQCMVWEYGNETPLITGSVGVKIMLVYYNCALERTFWKARVHDGLRLCPYINWAIIIKESCFFRTIPCEDNFVDWQHQEFKMATRCMCREWLQQKCLAAQRQSQRGDAGQQCFQHYAMTWHQT